MYSTTFTLHGCNTSGGRVTATLRRGSTEVATNSQYVSVITGPSIQIQDLVTSMEVGESDVFRIWASNLDTAITYTIDTEVTTNDSNSIGFNDTCSDTSRTETVSSDSSVSNGFTLHGCAATVGTVTATLSYGTTSLTASQDVTVTALPTVSSPTNPREIDSENDSVTLGWTSVSGSSRYRVEYRTTGSSEWTTDDDTITSTSHTVERLSGATAYDFQVSAYGDGSSFEADWGDPSTSVQVTTFPTVGPSTTQVDAAGATVTVNYNLNSPDFNTYNYWLKLRWGLAGINENEQEIQLLAATDDPYQFTGLNPEVNGLYRVDIQVCRDAARTNCQNNPGVLKYFIYVVDVDPSHPTRKAVSSVDSQLTFEMLLGTQSGRAYVIQAEKKVSTSAWKPVASPYIGFTGHTVLGGAHFVWVQSIDERRRAEMRVSATGHLGYRITIAEPDVAIIERPTAALSSTRSATQGNVELPLKVRNSTNGEVGVDIEVDCAVTRGVGSSQTVLNTGRYHGTFTVPTTATSESNLHIGSICSGIVLKDDDDVSLSARLIDDDFRQLVAAGNNSDPSWDHNTSSTLFDYQGSSVMGGLQMLIQSGGWGTCTSSFTLTLRNIFSSSTYDAVSTTEHCSTTAGDDWRQSPIQLAIAPKVADATVIAKATTCRMMLTATTSTSRSNCTIGDQSYGRKPSSSTATFAMGYIFKPGTGSVGFDDALREPKIQYYTGNASTDRFQILGARPPLDNEVVHKVGRTTGWTEGRVREERDPTCPGGTVGTADNGRLESNGYIECKSYTSGLATAGGDSGAPVFVRIGTSDNAFLVGILFSERGGEGIFIPIDRVYAESLRQGYDWDEQSLRPIPSLDDTAELLAERTGTGSTRVITATFSRGDFSPSLYYKAEVFRNGSATGDHCFVSIDKRHAKLGYNDESSTANCSVTEGTGGGHGNIKQIHVAFEGLTQIAGAYTVKLRACVRDASDDHQCGMSGSAGIRSVTMDSP